MPQCVLLSVELVVKGFGRKHVAVVLAYKVRLAHVGSDVFLWFAAGVLACVAEVVKCVDVLEERTLLEVSDAGSLARVVKVVRDFVGALVKLVAVDRLVDPDAPQDYRRMVSVLAHHLARVYNSLIFPAVITDILPARDLGKDHETELIAAIDKVMRLRVVRGPDCVKSEFVL